MLLFVNPNPESCWKSASDLQNLEGDGAAAELTSADLGPFTKGEQGLETAIEKVESVSWADSAGLVTTPLPG